MAAIPTVSGRMVIESLREQAELTRQAYDHYKEQLRLRDTLIKEAREVRIPWPIIEEATGISRQTARVSQAKVLSPEQAEYGQTQKNGM